MVVWDAVRQVEARRGEARQGEGWAVWSKEKGHCGGCGWGKERKREAQREGRERVGEAQPSHPGTRGHATTAERRKGAAAAAARWRSATGTARLQLGFQLAWGAARKGEANLGARRRGWSICEGIDSEGPELPGHSGAARRGGRTIAAIKAASEAPWRSWLRWMGTGQHVGGLGCSPTLLCCFGRPSLRSIGTGAAQLL